MMPPLMNTGGVQKELAFRKCTLFACRGVILAMLLWLNERTMLTMPDHL